MRAFLLSGLFGATPQITPSAAPTSASFFTAGKEISLVRTAVISKQTQLKKNDAYNRATGKNTDYTFKYKIL
jgi:hypothetical protein